MAHDQLTPIEQKIKPDIDPNTCQNLEYNKGKISLIKKKWTYWY